MASSDPHAPAELKKIWLTKTRSWPPRRAAVAKRSAKLANGSAAVRSAATKPASRRAGNGAREERNCAVAGERARRRARRQRGDEPADEVVGVGRERDGRGIGQAENGGDAALRARDEFTEDRLPFVVGEPRGV